MYCWCDADQTMPVFWKHLNNFIQPANNNSRSLNMLYNGATHSSCTERLSLENIPQRFFCATCHRSYKHNHHLKAHQKNECGLPPQFECTF
ncbi:uncharacterized protein LOC142326669 isoform X2 [Lycorma delicatula]